MTRLDDHSALSQAGVMVAGTVWGDVRDREPGYTVTEVALRTGLSVRRVWLALAVLEKRGQVSRTTRYTGRRSRPLTLWTTVQGDS
jgi:hypothetical protein